MLGGKTQTIRGRTYRVVTMNGRQYRLVPGRNLKGEIVEGRFLARLIDPSRYGPRECRKLAVERGVGRPPK